MTKLKDVAAYLGLSISTVSRVLNNYDRVAPETRKKVEEAIKKLDYHPDEIAQRLRTNSSDVIGVVVPDISNPFFADIVRGAQRAADEAGFTVLLCDTNSSVSLEKRSVSLLMRHKVFGIISASVAAKKDALEIYDPYDNIIFVDNVPELNRDYSSVSINNYLATKELINLLLKKGYNSIFTIAGPQNESSAVDRLNGYRDALADNNISVLDEHIRFGDYNYASGEEQMKAFLKMKNPPSAVFAANNFMAYGAMRVILNAGLSVPNDIAIATFDVFDNTRLIKDYFIYVKQPAFDIGFSAAQMSINSKNQNKVTNCCKMILRHTIV